MCDFQIQGALNWKTFKKKFIFLLLLLLVIAGISVFYPLINEKLVDDGISNNNIKYVVYLLIAQLILYTSTNVLEFIQGWIFLNVNTKLSISLISDFLKKLITMPLSFFESKLTTDIMLRVDDHNRIEEFFSNHSLQFLISIIVFIIYSVLLLNYSWPVFIFFIIVSIISVLWVYQFQGQRKYIDYKRFEIETENKNILYEIVNGISDLKINNATNYKTEQWQKTETDLFKLNKANMLLELKQSIGINYLSQLKNTLIIGYVAYLVINQQLTFGALLSISFIIGQLTLPIESFILYLYSYQDASISIDRLSDVYRKKDEDQLFLEHRENNKEHVLYNNNSIQFSSAKYSYLGPNSPSLFENLSINFPLTPQHCPRLQSSPKLCPHSHWSFRLCPPYQCLLTSFLFGLQLLQCLYSLLEVSLCKEATEHCGEFFKLRRFQVTFSYGPRRPSLTLFRSREKERESTRGYYFAPENNSFV